MYLDFLVPIPNVKGKITRKVKGNATYVNYEYDRVYNAEKKFNVPKRATIGKVSKADPDMMQPNQNFLIYFPEAELPDEKVDSKRSSCLKVGNYIVIKRILDEYGIPAILDNHFDKKDKGLLLDLISYSLISENNAGQYYPDYAYNHPLFTEDMHIYSDSKVSDFLSSVTVEQSVGFLNDWNSGCDHRQKIYISYDSTNKNCRAGDLELVEYGNAKVDTGDPIFNYAIGYDTKNAKPLFYEAYEGSIVDISQFEYTLGKIKGYGYKNIGFILDRGYFSKDNIRKMDSYGYDFVMMVKGMSTLVDELVLTNRGSFEDDRNCNIRKHHVYGKTVKRRLYADDENERYFHIYHSTGKEHGEREQVEDKLERLREFVEKQYGTAYKPGPGVEKYYDMFFDRTGVFTVAQEKNDVVQRELRLCGYFVIITSEKMTAEEALDLYEGRDASEKLFRGDKSYLGNKSARVYTNESLEAKIFAEFIALIVRNRIYKRLKDEAGKLEKMPNFMTVPAVIRELEKIELIRGFDRKYLLDHAVTKTQKMILKAFDMDAAYIKSRAARISEQLEIIEEKSGGMKNGENDE